MSVEAGIEIRDELNAAIDLDEIASLSTEELEARGRLPVLIDESCDDCRPRREELAHKLSFFLERVGGIAGAIDRVNEALPCRHMEVDESAITQALHKVIGIQREVTVELPA